MAQETDRELPLPPFFDPDAAGRLWQVPFQERAEQAAAWARRFGLRPAAEDAERFVLMIVDGQVTFCLPRGELFVAGRSGNGAVEDAIRLVSFIYRNLGTISQIVLTLDTHRPFQIFHPGFWVDAAGNQPAPFTQITVDDVERGRWRVNPAIAGAVPIYDDLAALERYALHYVRALHESGRYELTIWPYHALLGSVGHALLPIIEEAVFFHSLARQSQPHYEIKGANPLTENYSVFRPEVLTGPNGETIAEPNRAFRDLLLAADVLAIAGEAGSHCVAWSVDDFLTHLLPYEHDQVEKIYLLADCMSPVVVPGAADYTPQQEHALARFADAGMHVVASTTPISAWPRRLVASSQ